MADPGDGALLVERLRALAHPLRLRILEALDEAERNVGEIEAITRIAQPALSQQLGVLRQAGLVRAHRQGKLVYYEVEHAAFRAIRDGIEVFCQPPAKGVIGARAPVAAHDHPNAPQRPQGHRPPAHGAANFARLA